MVQLVFRPFNLRAVPGSQLLLTVVIGIGIWKFGDKATFLKGRTKDLGGLEVKHPLMSYTTDSDLFLSWLSSDLLMKGDILKKCLINMCI